MVLAADRQRGIGRKRLAGLDDPTLAAEHLAGQNQRLRTCPAFDETTIHQELIGSDPHANAMRRLSTAGNSASNVVGSPGETTTRGTAGLGRTAIRARR